MNDFATLVLSSDTRGINRGETALQSLAREGGRTERTVTRNTSKISKGFSDFGLVAAKSLAGIGAGLVTFATATNSLNQAKSLNAALAETSTLIEGTPAELKALESAARSMSEEFGGNAREQVEAFYQAISSGAGGVSEASEILDVANRLAVGGVTSVTTAVDVLTTATNAYAVSGLTAADASDTMFVGIKAGKTTADELSSALGGVISIAAPLGVSFDELVASTAALTTQGQSTSKAATGLAAILSSILKPTKEASDLSKELGLAFDSQALKAKGLSGFLEDVIEATNGSDDAMARLFGSQEAIIAAFSLAGAGGEKLAQILVDMEAKVGATEAAFGKISNSLSGRWEKAVSASADVTITLGNALLTVAVPALETSATVLGLVADNVDIFAIALGVLAVNQIPATVAGLISMTTWLATSEGLFIAGAVAAKGFAFAMNAIPFVAIVSGLTLVYRSISDAKRIGREYSAALGEMEIAQNSLTDATERFYTNINRQNAESLKASAEAAKAEIEAALDAAQDRLGMLDFLTAGLFDTKKINETEAEIIQLETALIDVETQISAIDHTLETMGQTGSAAGENTADSIERAVEAGYTFADIDFSYNLEQASITARELVESVAELARLNEANRASASYLDNYQTVLGYQQYGESRSDAPENPVEHTVIKSGSRGGRSGGNRLSEAQRTENELVMAAEQIYNKTRTAAEKYTIALKELDDHLDKNRINPDTYARAVEDLNEEFKEGQDDINGWADELLNSIGSMDEFTEALARMAVQYALLGSDGTGGIVGSIAGTMGIKLPSYDGGGYTGSGSRSGGLDGKGGQLALLHPQETVVDHTKGQSMPSGGGGYAPQLSASELTITDDGKIMAVVRAHVVASEHRARAGAVEDVRKRMSKSKSFGAPA